MKFEKVTETAYYAEDGSHILKEGDEWVKRDRKGKRLDSSSNADMLLGEVDWRGRAYPSVNQITVNVNSSVTSKSLGQLLREKIYADEAQRTIKMFFRDVPIGQTFVDAHGKVYAKDATSASWARRSLDGANRHFAHDDEVELVGSSTLVSNFNQAPVKSHFFAGPRRYFKSAVDMCVRAS